MNNNIDLEMLWNELLSRETRKVQRAFSRLDKDSQQAVLQHLTRISVEGGWHPEQRISAETALKALASYQ
jgi:NADH:ubiquinone oxidoreductase subunit E